VTITDLMPPVGTKTPIEKTHAANRVMDALEYVKPTVTAAAEQSSVEQLHSSHGRRESTERAVVLSRQPVAAATVVAPAMSDLNAGAYPYWLTIALAEPLATVTLTSFEAQLCFPPPVASPLLELARHFTGIEPRPEPELAEPQAYRTFVELADWLGMTQEKTANLLGMGRTTPLAWQREGHEPQPARARRLYQTHALVSTLMRRLGCEEMRRWLEAGEPSPVALIAQGDVTGADDLADELIFGTAPSRERLGAWVEETTDTDPPAAQSMQGQPRRLRRRPPRRRTR
jgi:hypothetical protein